VRSRLAAIALALVACGGAPSAPPPRPRPTGPVATYLHVPRAFFLRVDCAAIRQTPLAPRVTELWRASPLFHGLTGSASLDPIRDLDAMVATTGTVSSWQGGPMAPRWRAVLRHHEDASHARAMLARVAGEHGETLAWRESQGLVAAVLPGEISSRTPHAIVLTAAHEAVIAPEDELQAVFTAARDQAARRDAETDAIEPGLAAPDGELVRAESSDPPPILASLGATAARASVLRAGQGAIVHLELDFPDAAIARATAQAGGPQLAQLGANPMLVQLGVGRPLAAARVTANGPTVTVETQATFDELDAGLRLVAMASAGGL
jgi:hypothetical protein